MGDLFGSHFPEAVAAWVFLQVAAMWKLTGLWRTAAWLPIGVMAIALGGALLGMMTGFDHADIWMGVVLPFCLTWMVVLWVIKGIVGVASLGS
jgi:hypothetical protein